MGASADRKAARRLSERIEAMLNVVKEGETDVLLDTARRLTQLNDLFGPPDSAFERRLTEQIEARLAERPQRRVFWRPRMAWGAIAGLVIVVATLFTSPGQAVMAELMAILRLGRTEVRVEPEMTDNVRTFTATAEITLPDLPQAQATVVPRTLYVPTYLPEGYHLHRIGTSHFDEMPDWVQPLFIDVTYRRERAGFIWELSYRHYFVAPGGPGTIKALTYPPEQFESIREVTVGDHPAVLMAKEPTHPVHSDEKVLHLVWEGENAIFTLTAFDLSPEELVRIAESVAPYR